MKVRRILETQQPKEYNQLNKQNKKNGRRGNKEEHLSFNDVMKLMRHDSYYRGRGGSIKQK